MVTISELQFPPRDEDCLDHVAMMQVGNSNGGLGGQQESQETTTSDLDFYVTFFAYGADEIDVEVSRTERHELVKALVRIWEFEEEEIYALHYIHAPPISLQKPRQSFYILEQRRDSNSKQFVTDVLILCEVNAYGPQAIRRKQYRSVTWSRNRLRRIQVLALLRLDWLCEREETQRCVVTFNNVIWTHEDHNLRHLESGDYIQLDIFLTEEEARDFHRELQTYEEGECSRRLYTSDPQGGEVHESRTSEEDTIQTEAGHRSPGTCEALSSVEDATRDFAVSGEGRGGEEEAEYRNGMSLLQIASIKARVLRNWGNLSDGQDVFGRLPPPGNPSKKIISVEQALRNGSPEETSDVLQGQGDATRNDGLPETILIADEVPKLNFPSRKFLEYLSQNKWTWYFGCYNHGWRHHYAWIYLMVWS